MNPLTALRTAWRTMKRSLIAFGVALALGLLGMGALGMALYYPVAPVLALQFVGPDDWHGDWVWPALIGVGMAWSFGFLLAGWVNLRLQARPWPPAIRRGAYLAVLWGWALVLWWVTLRATLG
jgi:hypothetical protein